MNENFVVRTYQKEDFEKWNSFVNDSKNGTFLFHRYYIEYHRDRFEDFSLIVLDQKNKVVALFPANILNNILYSHQGLTYGGLVLDKKVHLSAVIQIFREILFFLKQKNITKIELKVIPPIYQKYPSDEIEYLAFLLKAKLKRRDSLAVIDKKNENNLSRVRKRGIEKGLKNDLKIVESDKFDVFWNEILIPNLNKRYGAQPVHTLEEITYLKSKFPENIKQFNVFKENKIVGGVTVYLTNNVIHPQYISGNKDFNNTYGGLDFLYHYIQNNIQSDARFFDFGPSNEDFGSKLNQSLHYWKESFGARTIVQNFYEIDVNNYSLLENVLI